MNNLGVIAGFYIDSAGVQHGFTDRDGRFGTINAPDAGTASGQGTSVGYINDLGQVTGSYTESNGDTVAFAGPIGRFTTVSDPAAPAFSTLHRGDQRRRGGRRRMGGRQRPVPRVALTVRGAFTPVGPLSSTGTAMSAPSPDLPNKSGTVPGRRDALTATSVPGRARDG